MIVRFHDPFMHVMLSAQAIGRTIYRTVRTTSPPSTSSTSSNSVAERPGIRCGPSTINCPAMPIR